MQKKTLAQLAGKGVVITRLFWEDGVQLWNAVVIAQGYSGGGYGETEAQALDAALYSVCDLIEDAGRTVPQGGAYAARHTLLEEIDSFLSATNEIL